MQALRVCGALRGAVVFVHPTGTRPLPRNHGGRLVEPSVESHGFQQTWPISPPAICARVDCENRTTMCPSRTSDSSSASRVFSCPQKSLPSPKIDPSHQHHLGKSTKPPQLPRPSSSAVSTRGLATPLRTAEADLEQRRQARMAELAAKKQSKIHAAQATSRDGVSGVEAESPEVAGAKWGASAGHWLENFSGSEGKCPLHSNAWFWKQVSSK